MIPQFNSFPEDSVTLNLVSMADIHDYQEELAYRIDHAERSHGVQEFQPATAEVRETSMVPLIWDLDDSPPGPPGIGALVDKNFSEYVSTSGVELLEDLEDARRSPREHLLLIILGLDGTSKLNPWIINDLDRVFWEHTSLVHIYTTKERRRTVHDLKRYVRNKENVVSYVKNGRGPQAKPVMERMDVLLYMLDRLDWTYKTYTRPDSSEREAFSATVPGAGGDPVKIKQTAVFEDQRYFTDVEETNVVFRSI